MCDNQQTEKTKAKDQLRHGPLFLLAEHELIFFLWPSFQLRKDGFEVHRKMREVHPKGPRAGESSSLWNFSTSRGGKRSLAEPAPERPINTSQLGRYHLQHSARLFWWLYFGSPKPIWCSCPAHAGWSQRETAILRLLLMKHGVGHWAKLQATGLLPGKTASQLCQQAQVTCEPGSMQPQGRGSQWRVLKDLLRPCSGFSDSRHSSASAESA